MTTWVYTNTQANCYTVGFYAPGGDWQPATDHATADEAAQRVHWLNGGHLPMERAAPELLKALKRVKLWAETGGEFPLDAVRDAIAAATPAPAKP